MEPTPDDVAAILDTLTSEPWPSGPDETAGWLARHHFASPAVPMPSQVPGAKSWIAQPAPGQFPAFGWHTFNDEFVGVHWFLWPSDQHDAVLTQARALAEAITSRFGAPAETGDDGRGGLTQLWRTRGVTIDMYAYDGRGRPPGRPEGPSIVQLHLDHTERADSMEAAARATRS